MSNKIKITTIDTRCNEMDVKQWNTFALNFVIGRDIPYCIVILSFGKKHRCYNLNNEFGGRGCCINTFEKWLKSKLEQFEKDINYVKVNEPDWFRSCGEDL